MARSKEEIQKLLRDKYINKNVLVTLDLQGNGGHYVGCKMKLSEMFWDSYRTQFKGTVIELPEKNSSGISLGTQYWIFPVEFDIIQEDNNTHKVKSLEKRVKTVEEIDRYGNDYIIELFQEEEKIIYISSALRTLLGISNKEKVGFAIDKKAKKYYIYKEEDESIGHEVIDGKIENNVEWRNLYNTFNPETQHPSKGKLKFHISHYLQKNAEFPELTFYVINENWYEKKIEKAAVKKPSSLKRDVGYINRIVEEPEVGSPEWVRLQMQAEENRQRGLGRSFSIPIFDPATTFTDRPSTTNLIEPND